MPHQNTILKYHSNQKHQRESCPILDQNSEMVAKIKLTYFDLRGRAEVIRILIHAANADFVDRRITKQEWVNDVKESKQIRKPFQLNMTNIYVELSWI